MNSIALRIILSVLICFNIVFYPLSIYSQEVEPTPTIDESPTPTTVVESTPTPFSEFVDLSPTPVDEITPIVDITPTPTIPLDADLQIVNSGDDTSVSATDSSSLTVNIESTNSAQVDNSVNHDVNTGDNISDNPVSNSDVKTGEAKSDVVIVNEVNQAIVGGEITPVLVNITEDHQGEIDLSMIQPCLDKLFGSEGQQSYIVNTGDNVDIQNDKKETTDTTITVNNDATINNDVKVKINTGSNDVNGLNASLTTGDAQSNVFIYNGANTTLVGDCNIFTIINLFKDQNGNIILPYELGMTELDSGLPAIYYKLDVTNSGDNLDINQQSSTNDSTTIDTQNNADVTSNVNSDVNTGGNQISGIWNGLISTGNATSTVKMVDAINTTIVGDRWMMLKINILGNWSGNIIGFDGPYIRGENYIILFFRIPASDGSGNAQSTNIVNSGDNLSLDQINEYSNTLKVNTNNTASVTNNVDVTANSGNNQVSGINTSLKTGDATSNISIFNFLNTTIIGNNWYFAIINIFDNFVGDIIFPRPDLAIAKFVDKTTALKNDQLTYTIKYANIGRYYANKTVLTDVLPQDVEFVTSLPAPTINGNNLSFSLGRLKPGSVGEISIQVKVKDIDASFDLINNAIIKTDTPESDKSNNSSSAVTKISFAPPQIQTNDNANNNNSGNSSNQNNQSTSTPSSQSSTTNIIPTPTEMPVIDTKIPAPLSYIRYLSKTKENPAEINQGSILAISDKNNCGFMCMLRSLFYKYWIIPVLSLLLVPLIRKRYKLKKITSRKT
ncbi:hypothetical protein A3C23_02685 [Candidatus Roizmanbacteria bacterium RIFCSPHIGHO2_02_FULL_37_13b]|uniref:DUF11 domain-containing protein n=1 Tax=Candidatus Roizmanbacteria bacterium RIFCSPLOWO2_02_FULL_36_11 TaxID=1802071 RepID=A0A1F7JG24_9BACT|nr:MAG: hypothetical protein A3C23_02685 [Candidatus Roizmanbacteria bacterium RIFCSPHIGHO2_02_FULL_37_13b]OGK54581.1 MAG: hypothetical protein A3H78_01705 [Candidatus Roizmanbacteria bacterium RIFCSPLOWO2_02_FULL_36_11]